MRRRLFLALAIVATLLPAQPALAADFDPSAMTFPVGGGDYRLTNSFGDCRDGCARYHEGEDIMAPKGTPVYAVADGIANWVSQNQSECCRLQIDHDNGWVTRYIHLNDDRQDENGNYIDYDNQGWGIAPGIVEGSPITKGQLIGWVGDSGNATETVTHLHFELRQYSGSIWNSTPIDPYPYLLIAEHNYVGQFYDDEDSVHQANIDKFYQAGITVGCNPPASNEFCPTRTITRGEMAAFISRALGLTGDTAGGYYNDTGGNLFEGDINRITEAGIGFGCTTDLYCPGQPILREEMAEMLVRAFGYDNPDAIDFFTDDSNSAFQESINKLANHEITLGCNPPDNDMFCPTETLTRAQMASFFVRALGL
ncbi:MAG: peptidoglycan DD-metalloendopeptidase family protein [Acidimicrobiia bacterium]